MNPLICLAAILACAGSLLLPADARSAVDDSWHFRGVLYGYVPSVDGETTVSDDSGGGDAGVEFDSLLQSLQFAFMGSFDASMGRWGAFADVVYADFGATRSATRALSIGGDRIPADASAKVGFDLNGWCWTMVGTYAVAERDRASLQAVAGVRMLDLTTDLTWRLTGNVGSIPIEAREGQGSSSLENWDAVIGVRGRLALDAGHRWFVPYYLDLGAGDSDLTWQAVAGLGYAFGWGDVLAGWRHVDYEIEPGGDVERIRFSGPAVGVAFRW